MKPTTKTPYEIRLELLQLAFDILKVRHETEKTSPPTSENVIAEADKLRSFVNSQ